MPYDIFISYSRLDNTQGRVTELKERIEADYRAFAGEDLTYFFDRDDIHGMGDWRHRLASVIRVLGVNLGLQLTEEDRTS